MQLLDGKALAAKKLADLKSKILDSKLEINLDIILVGDDPSSLMYDQMKQKKAAEVGIGGQIYHLPKDVSFSELQKLIVTLNQNPQTSAFFVQLPIPNLSDSSTLLNNILPQKDADGLTAANLGLLFQQNKLAVAPATAIGILNLLDEYQINLESKKAVIINDSSIVGLPLLALFNSRHATVAICHRYTKDLLTITRDADIVVSATGVKNLVTADMVKDGVIAIDVAGGDIDFAAVSKKSSYITPTFGGVGPMTVASLLENTYLLAMRK
jgi:methylenetetrahydrofolate dehydrogenase (NADP+)/methenyltetrahydrofolate cyclohydrolase